MKPPPPVSQPARRQPILKVSGVEFGYNGHPVLQDVSLEVGAGEAVALVGRNGAGKSTLLKCITGLLRPAAGEILVNGRATRGREVADICREVAYLPQNPNDLLFADSVAGELGATLENHFKQPPAANGAILEKIRRAARRRQRPDRRPEFSQQIQGHLAELGIGDLRDAYPRDLSAGQRQRVALGAVSITGPDLFLFDEPTRGLDYDAKEALAALWRRWLEQGKGVLLVTHDVELAAHIADRVVILRQGRVEAVGRTAVALGGSPHFAPQISRLFSGTGWLTVEDVVRGLKLEAAKVGK